MVAQVLASGARISVAESCTGGLLAARLTERAGASSFFVGGVIAYEDAAKRAILGVDGALLQEHGAVSGVVAEAMATGVRAAFRTDIGIGLTGISGPTGGTKEKPVGMVWICVAGPHHLMNVQRFNLNGDRKAIRQGAVAAAMEMLERAVEDYQENELG